MKYLILLQKVLKSRLPPSVAEWFALKTGRRKVAVSVLGCTCRPSRYFLQNSRKRDLEFLRKNPKKGTTSAGSCPP